MSSTPQEPIESSSDKVTLSIYVFKEFADELEKEADKEHRKLSHFIILLLIKALSERTGRDMTHLIPYL